MTYLLLVVGLVLLLVGANFLVDSSVAIAQKAKISNFIIGLTIVGMGTSMPELYVSLSSAIQGLGDMSLGNVVGSNICNVLLILGITAVISPFAIERATLRRDIPFTVIISILLLFLCYDTMLPHFSENVISRFDGAFLLVIFAGYMWLTMKFQVATDEYEEGVTTRFSGKPAWIMWGVAVLSLAALIGGGNLFLGAAVELAKSWGMSDAVISITLLAVGTSLPELITSVIAALKHNPQLALGNVLGSNVFNILFILGVSSVVSPIHIASINIVDFGVLIVSAILTYLVAFTFKKRVIDRVEGIIFLALYVAYTLYLLVR